MKLQSYPASIEERDGGFAVLFRDLPNTFTYGETYEDAVKYAHEVLEMMVSAMIEDDDAFNPPSEKQAGEIDISIPLHLSFALLLRVERKKRGWTQTDLAKVLGVSQQQAAKLEKPSENRSIGAIAKTLSALGYEIEITDKSA